MSKQSELHRLVGGAAAEILEQSKAFKAATAGAAGLTEAMKSTRLLLNESAAVRAAGGLDAETLQVLKANRSVLAVDSAALRTAGIADAISTSHAMRVLREPYASVLASLGEGIVPKAMREQQATIERLKAPALPDLASKYAFDLGALHETLTAASALSDAMVGLTNLHAMTLSASITALASERLKDPTAILTMGDSIGSAIWKEPGPSARPVIKTAALRPRTKKRAPVGFYKKLLRVNPTGATCAFCDGPLTWLGDSFEWLSNTDVGVSLHGIVPCWDCLTRAGGDPLKLHEAFDADDLPLLRIEDGGREGDGVPIGVLRLVDPDDEE